MTIDVDDILRQIGDFGPYQKRIFLCLCTPSIIKAFMVMCTIFMFQLPDIWCQGSTDHPISAPDPSEIQNETSDLPPPADRRNNSTTLAQCSVSLNNTVHYMQQPGNWSSLDLPPGYWSFLGLTRGNWSFLGLPRGNWSSLGFPRDNSTGIECSQMVYKTTEVYSSILTEYGLVCNNAGIRSHSNMGFFLCSLVGALVIGILADIVGRRRALLLCVAISTVSSISLYFIQPILVVLLVRSIQGVSCVMFAIATAMGMEIVGQTKRTFAGVVVQLFWSGGQLLLVLIVWLANHWRVCQLVYGLLCLPVFVLICWVPESPRWLIDKDRYEEATHILSRIAKSNQTKFPDGCLQKPTEETKVNKAPVWSLLANRKLLTASAILLYDWFAVSFLFSGLNLNLENLSGFLYVNFLLSVSVEFLGCLLCLALVDRTGRRTLFVSGMFLASLSCLTINFPTVFAPDSLSWTVTLLAMTGKLLSATSYSTIYLMSVEILPTVVRNSGLGLCCLFEDLAGMIVPYVADMPILLGDFVPRALPTTVFGGVALFSALLSLLLPETLGRPLPETLEDVSKLFVTLGRPSPETLEDVSKLFARKPPKKLGKYGRSLASLDTYM